MSEIITSSLEKRPIGIWGQRHLRYLKRHRRTVYANLLTSGKLNEYLADLNEQAEDMFFQLVKELAEKEDITETLKAENQMLWVQRMNVIRETATEIINSELIYAQQVVFWKVNHKSDFFGRQKENANPYGRRKDGASP